MTQTHYKRWGLLWRCKDGSVRKLVNAMNHLNTVKDKNHIVISIIGEKSLDKLQRAFTIKALSKLRSDGNHVNKINSVKKITASITHNGRRLVTFPLRSGTSQGYPVLPLLFNIALEFLLSAVQCSSVAQSCPTLFDPMDHSTPGLPVHHQLPEFTQTHVH